MMAPAKKPKYQLSFIRAFAMVGGDFERADLAGRDLRGVNFTDASLRAADLSGSDLRGARFVKADLSRANLYQADCEGADFSSADMSMCYYKAASFKDARMCYATLRCSIGKNALFINTDLRGTDFVNAFLIGARFDGARLDKAVNFDRAILRCWLPPEGGRPSYDPVPGWRELDESALGGISLQENTAHGAARRRRGEQSEWLPGC